MATQVVRVVLDILMLLIVVLIMVAELLPQLYRHQGTLESGLGYAGPVEDGYIKIVRVYNRVLTVEEIKASYNPGWKNLEVKFNGQLFDINSVSCSSGSDFRAGSTLTITQSLNSGDKISIVYKPANQLLRQYTIP